MKKLFYPALFHKAEEGGFWITFPDFPECMTQGENMQDAYEMAWDALGLAVVSRIENREALPPVTEPYAVTLDPDTFCVVVPFDLISYQKKHNSKAVKKTLSIPEWLNEAAVAMNINFSQLLRQNTKNQNAQRPISTGFCAFSINIRADNGNRTRLSSLGS